MIQLNMGTIYNGDPFTSTAFVRKVEAFMGNYPIDNTSFSLLDYMVHVNDSNYKTLHPDRAKIDAAKVAPSALNEDIEAEVARKFQTNPRSSQIPLRQRRSLLARKS